MSSSAAESETPTTAKAAAPTSAPEPVPTPVPGHPVASVVMPTRNRREDLRRAIISSLKQTVPVEIVVRDDGSTDGTEEMVRREFPMVNYARNPQPVGSILNRNIAVSAATTPYVISIDDDAAFESPRTVEQTIADFQNPRVGAIAIPYVDVLKDPRVEQLPPDKEQVWCVSYFRGCAAAWRRELFMALGGYSTILFHMAEEPELCQRFLDAGFVTRLGTADPIHHYESPKRNSRMVMSLIARNGILMGLLNAPTWMLPIHILGSGLKSLLWGIRIGQPLIVARGIARGYLDCLKSWPYRRPMSRRAYHLYRWLTRNAPVPLSKIEHRLPMWRSQPLFINK